jgi:hypothetical protein
MLPARCQARNKITLNIIYIRSTSYTYAHTLATRIIVCTEKYFRPHTHTQKQTKDTHTHTHRIYAYPGLTYKGAARSNSWCMTRLHPVMP